ncbi:MAG: DUF1177 family protein [Candidatus Aminicenantes bacterium]|nr:DUF1177 family protein [Candidatus Aminicenantes bacterium]
METHKIRREKGETTFIKINIRGKEGKSKTEIVPTLGIIGRLGGIGARPHKIGLVSEPITPRRYFPVWPNSEILPQKKS